MVPEWQIPRGMSAVDAGVSLEWISVLVSQVVDYILVNQNKILFRALWTRQWNVPWQPEISGTDSRLSASEGQYFMK